MKLVRGGGVYAAFGSYRAVRAYAVPGFLNRDLALRLVLESSR